MSPASAPPLVTRWTRLWILTLATSVPLTVWMVRANWDGSTPILHVVIATLFFVLTTWTALWFWVAAAGFRLAWRRGSALAKAPAPPTTKLDPEQRTAILVPVYNEDAAEVFARVEAMRQSVAAAGAARAFDFYILSDTTNPDVFLEEVWHWLRMSRQRSVADMGAADSSDGADDSYVYYRRRCKNVRRKAGNIQDFCERWGAHYRNMIILDADSLIDGSVFVQLAARMQADPQLGLLQTPTLPLGDSSLLSRCQQFAARLCRPLLSEGLDWFSGDGGNYFGHNAILRTAAFTRHCGLSDLPGQAPLGGEILSHDFVEAALMRRAGYRVRMASDLTASYEQCPTTLTEFAQRDQRWCQGNMQHALIAAGERIPVTSRFHFVTGIMSYALAPLWLCFLLLSALAWIVSSASPTASLQVAGASAPVISAASLFAIVMAMLVAPRAFGTILAAREPSGLAGFGGMLRLVGSLLLEFVISVLLAPIMMAFHSLFVISTLQGRSVQWGSQNRSDVGVPFRQAWQNHRGQTLAGLVAAGVLAALSPASLIWASPVLVGLICSIPIAMLVSSARLGAWFKRRGLLEIPEEVHPPAIVEAYRRQLGNIHALGAPPRKEIFRRFLESPALLRAHIDALRATREIASASDDKLNQLADRINSNQWDKITIDEKRAVLIDPSALTALHEQLWHAKTFAEPLHI